MIAVDEEENNYPYVAARVRARKSRLLKADTYRKLLLMSVPEISRYLGESEYRREMAESAGLLDGAALVEFASYRNLARSLKEVLGYCRSELRVMVASYLGKWDAHNVKAVLRGRYAGAPADEIEAQLIPAGSFDIRFLKSLMGRENNGEIVAAARRRGLPLSEDALISYMQAGRLSTLEDDIDRGYYARLLGSGGDDEAKAVFISFVRREIDVHNLQTLLRLKTEGLLQQQIMQFMLPGGLEFGGRSLARIAGLESAQDVINAIRLRKRYAAAEEGGGSGWQGLRLFALALDRMHALESQKLERLYPLSVLPVLDYMLRKETEVRNLRILARGKQSGLQQEEISAALMM